MASSERERKAINTANGEENKSSHVINCDTAGERASECFEWKTRLTVIGLKLSELIQGEASECKEFE